MLRERGARQSSVPASSSVAESTSASRRAGIFTDSNTTDDTDTASLDSEPPLKRRKGRQGLSHLQSITNIVEEDDLVQKRKIPAPLSQANGTSPPRHANAHISKHGNVPPLATPTLSSRPTVRNLLSNKVDFVLSVTYGGHPLGEAQHIEIDWLDRKTYDKVDAASHQRLAEFNHVDPSIHLYRKHGVCKIVRHAGSHENERDDANQSSPSEQEVESRTMHKDSEWAEVPQFLIMRFKSEYRYDDFHLELKWDYSGFVKPVGDDEHYAKSVKDLINEKMRTNWKDDHYIPRIDLDEILQDETIERLIRCDKSIAVLVEEDADSTSPFDMDEFISLVSAWGTKLLAISIYVELPLICLKLMLDNDKRDLSLPFGPREMSLPKKYSTAYRNFLMWQGSFVAHHFEPSDNPRRSRDFDHSLPYREVKAKVVMPIHFDKDNDHVGNGSYGDVFRVTVDPDHHYFDPVSTRK